MARPISFLPGMALLAGLGLLAGCAPERPQPAAQGPTAYLALPPAGAPAQGAGTPYREPVLVTRPDGTVGVARSAEEAERIRQAGPRPTRVPEAPLLEGSLRDSAALAAACRNYADRILVTRDRGDIMREDERDSRQGSYGSTLDIRGPLAQMGRRFEEDRIARDCIARNTRGTPDR